MTKSKSFNKSPKQRALYHAFIDLILENEDAMDEGVADKLKKRKQDDADKDKGPSAGSNRGLKRHKTSKDTKPSKKAKSTESSKCTSKSQPRSTDKSAQAEEPVFEAGDTQGPHNLGEDTGNTDVPYVVNVDPKDRFKKPERPPTPDPKWNKCKSKNPEGDRISIRLEQSLPLVMSRNRQIVTVDYLFNNDLSILARRKHWQNIHDIVDRDKGYQGPKRQRFYRYASNRVSKHDVYSTKRILAVTNVKVKEWYGYGHLEEIEVRRLDQQLYKFIEGDFPRLHLHDIEDMLILPIQNRLFNLKGDVILQLAAALYMFIRRIVIQKRVEDLQLGVKSYQKKLNISRSMTHKDGITNLKPYSAYSNPQGFIYMDKLGRNRLMCSHELYKFSNGKLIYLCDTLKDMANNLEMGYTSVMPRRRWSNLDKKRSRIMIKDIDHQLLDRRLMRSLEKFVGGRYYGEDPRLLQRTI
ncbi:hypothetical protein Tco_0425375 [Tanacetum coccineum]